MSQNADYVRFINSIARLKTDDEMRAETGHGNPPEDCFGVLEILILQARNVLADAHIDSSDPREGLIVVDHVGEPHPFDADYCGSGCQPAHIDSSGATVTGQE